MSKNIHHTFALISHASKVMLKILNVRLQQYMKYELPDIQAGFRESRGTRDQIANIRWIIEKVRVPEKHLLLLCQASTSDYAKSLTVWIQTNCGKFWKRWGYQTTLHVSWNTSMQVKKQQLEPDMEHQTGSKFGKGIHQDNKVSPCLFNFYAEYIMWHAQLDEAQAGIKIARRCINNLRYADDTMLIS